MSCSSSRSSSSRRRKKKKEEERRRSGENRGIEEKDDVRNIVMSKSHVLSVYLSIPPRHRCRCPASCHLDLSRRKHGQ